MNIYISLYEASEYHLYVKQNPSLNTTATVSSGANGGASLHSQTPRAEKNRTQFPKVGKAHINTHAQSWQSPPMHLKGGGAEACLASGKDRNTLSSPPRGCRCPSVLSGNPGQPRKQTGGDGAWSAPPPARRASPPAAGETGDSLGRECGTAGTASTAPARRVSALARSPARRSLPLPLAWRRLPPRPARVGQRQTATSGRTGGRPGELP